MKRISSEKMCPKRFSYSRFTSTSERIVSLEADAAPACSSRAHSDRGFSPIRGCAANASRQSCGSSSHQIVSAPASSSLPPSNGRDASICRTHSDDPQQLRSSASACARTRVLIRRATSRHFASSVAWPITRSRATPPSGYTFNRISFTGPASSNSSTKTCRVSGSNFVRGRTSLPSTSIEHVSG